MISVASCKLLQNFVGPPLLLPSYECMWLRHWKWEVNILGDKKLRLLLVCGQPEVYSICTVCTYMFITGVNQIDLSEFLVLIYIDIAESLSHLDECSKRCLQNQDSYRLLCLYSSRSQARILFPTAADEPPQGVTRLSWSSRAFLPIYNFPYYLHLAHAWEWKV